jgi:hypothetical protein
VSPLCLFPVWGFFIELNSYFADSDVLHYCRRTSPCNFRARAPFYVLPGFLLSADAFELYEGLPQPVWIANGTRGDFNDYCREGRLLSKDNWSGEVFQTGALPFFEMTSDFIAAYEQFLQEH